jgi:flagellar biosynthesis regulator FlaF
MTKEELEENLKSDLGKTDNALMEVLRNGLIRYAFNKGATAEWCNSLRPLDYRTLLRVIDVIYGLPEPVKKD